MVKQLQRGLVPNSRLQSKSRVKSCTLILTQFPLKIVFTACFQSWIPLIKPRKCCCVLKNPQREFFSFYVLNKQTATDLSYNFFHYLVFHAIERGKQKPSGSFSLEMVFLEFRHCGFCFCKVLIRKHFSLRFASKLQSESTLTL